MKERKLVEVAEPRLFEDIFPYDLPPRMVFDGPVYEEIDGEIVAFDPREVASRNLRISDTTFRDGQQSRPPYTVDQIETMYDYLAKLDGGSGLIINSEFFLYSPKDREAVERCLALGHTYPKVTGWIRANEGDLQLVKNAGLDETGVLTSCSDYHIFFKMRSTRKRIFDDYVRVMESALEAGIQPRCHLEDVTRADIDGFVVPFVQKMMRLSEQAPEGRGVKVRLCDTMGFGLHYPGAALPRSVPKLVHRMRHDAGVPSDRLEWHGHNDFHRVHANAATAWLYGCDILNATLFGIGERTGNPPLEGAVMEYIAIKGTLNGLNPRVITEAAEYYEEVVGTALSPNYPFVGREFNLTRAGIHADGLSRDERVYNIFDTRALLNVAPRVAITDKSGADGVALWVNNFLGLEGDQRLGKVKLHKIARWVVDQYEVHHRNTAISEREMEEQVRLHFPDLYAARKGRPPDGCPRSGGAKGMDDAAGRRQKKA